MKKSAIIGIGALLAICGVYMGIGVFYSSHYFPGTSINTIRCGNRTADYVEQRNKNKAEHYILTLTDRKKTQFCLMGKDFSYAYRPRGEEAAILKKQNAFLWPMAMFKKHNHTLSSEVTYDASALQATVDQLSLFQKEYIEQPVNAQIVIKDTEYELVPEVPGNDPIPTMVFEEIQKAVAQGQTSCVLGDECYRAPEVTAKDPVLQRTRENIEAYLAATIHYEIDGQDENLDREHILPMLSIAKDGNVRVNTEKVAAFVQYLASKYNTYGDRRSFKTTKGDTIEIGGGDYGWVISKSKEQEQILADLEGGKAVNREPMYEQRALHSGLEDIGDTYIEIDYTKQRLWYYENGKKKLTTKIVSGNLRQHNGSVDGIYKIVYKERNATLVGENYSSAVSFFMPFAYNIGIHDANWRSQFGGKIYKTAGSHGCVNIPPKKAKKLFEMVEKGTPVVAYYREKVELTNQAAQYSNAFSYVRKE
ncbi:Putative peptidoglycan binding domain-containing protein [Lachnospiraceae bacterium XBB1006]|nr:Putative peptidoglycan binding domain-containing protein [Lachnospiraceae bacterium XBB1006]